MPDFLQNGLITTLHDLGTIQSERLELMVEKASRRHPIGLVLPVTASDMRAAPFSSIMDELAEARFVDTIVVALNVAPHPEDYRETREMVGRLGEKGQVLWMDGPRVQKLYEALDEAGLGLGRPGKGRAVWTGFGYLLADPRLQSFALHDCDIVNYDREMLARLCLPMVHPTLDYEFCKAYYARTTNRMHGRVVRLLLTPFLRALQSTLGSDRFIDYLASFRYPLSGEFAVSSNLARSNRIPSDWGLEVGTLAEVFRNTALKRVCQIDVCQQYEHKHQPLSADDPGGGLMRMGTDILTTILRTLSSMGKVLEPALFTSLRCSYLRSAQDAIRQYSADALVNGLAYDRHEEEQAIEGFAGQIVIAGQVCQEDPSGAEAIPNWARVLSALPDFPELLRQAAKADAEDGGER